MSFIANDTLTGDSYGLLPYNAYGELKNEEWRFAAGLQNDVFNPRKPSVISLASMFSSGNTGSFRSQARIERYLNPSPTSEYSLQIALSDPIQSVFGSRDLRIQEDNGWPNVEGRINMGLGLKEERRGGRKARAFELGSSEFVGQIRTTRSILSPPDPQSPTRTVVDFWGFGIDAEINITQSMGVHGELFTGSGLGEYNGGIGPRTYRLVTKSTSDERAIVIPCLMRVVAYSIPSFFGVSKTAVRYSPGRRCYQTEVVRSRLSLFFIAASLVAASGSTLSNSAAS